jgi:hypothetical protein
MTEKNNKPTPFQRLRMTLDLARLATWMHDNVNLEHVRELMASLLP